MHPVQQKVHRVTRRAWRLQAQRACGACVTAVVGVAFLAGVADYGLRFEDPGVRLLSSLAVAAATIWSIRRWLYPLLVHRPSDLETAQRIEQRLPHLHDRLSSSLAFLAQAEDEATAGSPDLRRAVVSSTAADIEPLDLTRSLDPSKPRRVAAGTVLVCALVAVVCACDGSAAALAARRLAWPWSSAPWPKRNHLEFVKRPTRIAVGADFEVELVDRNGRLPEVVEIEYWFADEPANEIQVKEMKFFGDRMVHRLENVRRPFRYRATGGDDRAMPWTALEVAEPAQVESLDIRLVAPPYTGWPVAASGENIDALEGTVIAARGRLDKPAAAVELRTEEPSAQVPVPVQVAADGLSFTIRHDVQPLWVVSKSTAYWFDVTDPQGLRSGSERRWSIRAIPDAAPTVSLDSPSGNAFVTVAAIVRLAGLVKDDLAVRAIRVQYHRSDSSDGAERQVVEVYRGPDTVAAPAKPPPKTGRDRGDTRPVDFAWDLSSLTGLKPGMWIDFELVAEDYKPQAGQGSTRRLTVISAGELEERVGARQAFVLGQLAEVLRVQREVRSQVESVQIGLETTKQVVRKDVDQLQAAELKQRQVSRLLSDPNDGVEVQIGSLLHELQSNRIDSPEVVQRMIGLLSAIGQLTKEPLPEIQRQLVQGLKLARETLGQDATADAARPAVPGESLTPSLAAAGTRQDEVIAVLERLLGELSQWDNYRRFSREITRLRQAQEEIRQDTDKLRLDHVGQELAGLPATVTADLRRLAARQVELARDFDKIQARMDTMRGELAESDPAVAETLAEASEIARRAAIGGRMRESGRAIEEYQLGPSTAGQDEILRSLQEMLDALANRREHELSRLLDKLTTAGGELAELRQQQAALSQGFEAAAALTDEQQRRRELERLQALERELAEKEQRLSRRLERLSAEEAAKSLAEAATHAQQAAEAAEQANAASALAEARRAEQALQDAEQKLNDARQKAEEDLLNGQLTRIGQEVAGLLRRQESVVQTTGELEQLRGQQEGRFTRAQTATVATLAREERAVAADTSQLAESLSAAPIFSLGLQGAVRDMERAAAGLETQETGSPTRQAEERALTRLQQLQESLKRDAPPADNQTPKAGGDGSQQPSADAIQRLAELRLLKLMQEAVNRQTSDLEQRRLQTGSLSAEDVALLKDLADEQGRLAAIVAKLATPAAPPADQPPTPPEVPGKPGIKSDLDRELDKELMKDLE